MMRKRRSKRGPACASVGFRDFMLFGSGTASFACSGIIHILGAQLAPYVSILVWHVAQAIPHAISPLILEWPSMMLVAYPYA